MQNRSRIKLLFEPKGASRQSDTSYFGVPEKRARAGSVPQCRRRKQHVAAPSPPLSSGRRIRAVPTFKVEAPQPSVVSRCCCSSRGGEEFVGTNLRKRRLLSSRHSSPGAPRSFSVGHVAFQSQRLVARSSEEATERFSFAGIPLPPSFRSSSQRCPSFECTVVVAILTFSP